MIRLALAISPLLVFAVSCEKQPTSGNQNAGVVAEAAGWRGYEERRERLRAALMGLAAGDLRNGVLPPVPDGAQNVYGAYAGTLLRLGIHPAASNEELRRLCEAIGTARSRAGQKVQEENFTGQELARVYASLEDSPLLEPATREAIRAVFLRYDFSPLHHSENHHLIFRVMRLLMAERLPDDVFQADRKSGRELAADDSAWLKDFMRFRARRGWGEFDASAYQFLSFNAVLSLHDLSRDPELRRLAGMMANLLLADMAVDMQSGLYAGARDRIYNACATDPSPGFPEPPFNDTNEITYLYFGIADPVSDSGRERLLRLKPMNYWERSNESLFSSFRPLPVVAAIASGRQGAGYLNRERKHLHNMADVRPKNPLQGSIRKVTRITPDYALGGIVRQDPYPEGLKSGVYARHQQHDWSFQVPVDTGIRIFTHHPGTTVQHGYWTGDMKCGCTDGFLHGAAHIATFRIPQGQKHNFIHACIPRHKFDEVIEKDGWIFARKRKAYAALHLPGGWEWTREGEWKDREVISHGLRKASVFEAGSEEEAGSFEDFRREISANKIEFDPDSMRLRYVSKRSGTLELTGDGTRLLDGAEPDLNFPTYDSPYLQSAWDSGVIHMQCDGLGAILDFRASALENQGAE